MPAPRDLDKGLDALYAAPLSEFVGARDALVKSLAASGRKEDAARIKALKKPGTAAWAVNRLAFVAPRLLEALVESGDRLRKDPARALATRSERRTALNAARLAAERELAAAGHAASADVARRVAATLEAIAAYGSAPGRPAAGRLTEDVPAPGFDEIASLGLLGGAAGARRPPAPGNRPGAGKRAHPAAQARHEAAKERALEEKRRREARKALARRTAEAKAARARLSAAAKALEALRRKKAGLEESLASVVAGLKTLEAELAEARAASDAADAAERETRAFARE